MPVLELTPAVIKAAQCPPGKAKENLYDQTVKSFLVEVRPGGKTYYLRYRDQHGTLKQKKLGDAEILTLAEARKLAIKLKSQILINGDDPVAATQLIRSIPTLAEFAEEQLLPYAQQTKRSWKSDRSHLEHHLLPTFGKRHLDTLQTKEISDWLGEKQAAGYAPATLNRMLGVLSWAYTLGAKWGVPGTQRNPTQGIPLLPVHNQREVFLTETQIATLMDAVADSPNRELQPFVQLSILLGTRKNELVQAVWADVDEARQIFRVPPHLAKNGRERFIPLSQTAMTVLDRLPRRSPWLLPNPKTGKPYVSFYHAWDTARKAAQLPHCRWHDLRHTAASLMAGQGIGLYVIGKILGHANAKVTERYAHLTDTTLRAAVESAAQASGL